MTECERLIANGTFTRDFFKPEVRCDFLVDEKRKKLWAIQLDLLAQFDQVCCMHGLKYCAIGGTIFYKPTLFGAYRDQTLAEIHAYIQVLVLNETYRSFSARLRLSEGLVFYHLLLYRFISCWLLWWSYSW